MQRRRQPQQKAANRAKRWFIFIYSLNVALFVFWAVSSQPPGAADLHTSITPPYPHHPHKWLQQASSSAVSGNQLGSKNTSCRLRCHRLHLWKLLFSPTVFQLGTLQSNNTSNGHLEVARFQTIQTQWPVSADLRWFAGAKFSPGEPFRLDALTSWNVRLCYSTFITSF